MTTTLDDRIRDTFPITPYPSQVELASQIYQSLANNKKVSIFESPTGTGKSFCLIVGAIRWLLDTQDGEVLRAEKVAVPHDPSFPDWFTEYEDEPIQQPPTPLTQQKIKYSQHHKQPNKADDEFLVDVSSDDDEKHPTLKQQIRRCKPIQIIYCSRTHTQIKQWVSEIKKIPKLAHRINLISLSSRQQLCINPTISAHSSLSKLNHMCKLSQKESKASKATCQFFDNFKQWKSIESNQLASPIMDLEDVKREGLSCKICPYYAAKHQMDQYDIVCMPYQLLLERLPSLANPVVIIDEAHNFGNAILQRSSCHLSHKQLKSVVVGLQSYKKKYHQRVKAKTFYLLSQLLSMALGLLECVEQEHSKQEPTTQLHMIKLMVQLGLQNLELAKLLRFLDDRDMRRRISGFIDTQGGQSDSYASFETYCTFIQVLVMSNQSECVVYVERGTTLPTTLIKLSALCNDTTYQQLLDKCQSLILIGGTMAPLQELEVFEKKLNSQSYVQKSYPHIIPQHSCQLMIVPGYPKPLSFSHKSKTDNLHDLLQHCTQIMHDIQSIVPKGIVVFAQSYKMLTQLEAHIIAKPQLKWSKTIFWDRGSDPTNSVFQLYQSTINKDQQGAMLFSVVGGTLSEGINFSDDLCRAVIILGVPFPNLMSVEVQQQMKKHPDGGQEYYENMAMRGVNQSIGRAIRHIKDYALLYLIDQKFMDARIKSKLSHWLQSRICSVQSSQELSQLTNTFFSIMK